MMPSNFKTLIKNLDKLSLKYHRLSCLFSELKKSVEIQAKTKSYKEVSKTLKNIDFKKLEIATDTFKDITLTEEA